MGNDSTPLQIILAAVAGIVIMGLILWGLFSLNSTKDYNKEMNNNIETSDSKQTNSSETNNYNKSTKTDSLSNLIDDVYSNYDELNDMISYGGTRNSKDNINILSELKNSILDQQNLYSGNYENSEDNVKALSYKEVLINELYACESLIKYYQSDKESDMEQAIGYLNNVNFGLQDIQQN